MPLTFKLPASSCRSIEGVTEFFKCHEIDLCHTKGEQVRAFREVDHYILTVEYRESTYEGKDDVAFELVEQWVALLQGGFVYRVLHNVHKQGAKKPLFLYWLSCDVASEQLSQVRNPSYVSVVNTFYAACYEDFYLHSTSQVKCIEAKLTLECARLPTFDQMQIVINQFVEPLKHEYKYLPYVNKVQCLKAEIREFNDRYNYCDLYVKKNASHKSYSISLLDLNTDEYLYKEKDIGSIMLPLERGCGGGSIIPYAKNRIVLKPWLEEFTCQHENFEEENVYYKLTLKSLGNTFEYKSSYSDGCKTEVIAQLNRIKSTFPDHIESKFAVKYRWQVIDQLNKLSIAPNDKRSRAVKNCSDEVMLHCLQTEACNLHTLSQESFAQWLTSAPLSELNAFVLALLSKHQSNEIYRLPACIEVIEQAQSLLAYLLDAKSSALVEGERLLSILDKESLEVLTQAKSHITHAMRSKIDMLHKCCGWLSQAEKIQDIRNFFQSEYPNVRFLKNYSMAYSPEESCFVLVASLHVLSDLYHAFGKRCRGRNIFLGYDRLLDGQKLPDTLLNDNVLLQFVLQRYVKREHFINSWCIPISVGGISFSMHNHHDNVCFYPYGLVMHDYFYHAYYISSSIERPWKLVNDAQRMQLTEHLYQVYSLLMQQKESVCFLEEQVSLKEVLHVSSFLLFYLFHETSTKNTNTRARILPCSTSKAFLEKKHAFMENKYSSTFNPSYVTQYLDLPEDIKSFLPIKSEVTVHNTLPYAIACWLFDVVVEQGQTCYREKHAFDVKGAVKAFKQYLKWHEERIYLFEKNWAILIKKGIVFENLRDISDKTLRCLYLTMPIMQERIYCAAYNWDLEANAF